MRRWQGRRDDADEPVQEPSVDRGRADADDAPREDRAIDGLLLGAGRRFTNFFRGEIASVPWGLLSEIEHVTTTPADRAARTSSTPPISLARCSIVCRPIPSDSVRRAG